MKKKKVFQVKFTGNVPEYILNNLKKFEGKSVKEYCESLYKEMVFYVCDCKVCHGNINTQGNPADGAWFYEKNGEWSINIDAVPEVPNLPDKRQ